jgi:hypothetical protein
VIQRITQHLLHIVSLFAQQIQLASPTQKLSLQVPVDITNFLRRRAFDFAADELLNAHDARYIGSAAVG